MTMDDPGKHWKYLDKVSETLHPGLPGVVQDTVDRRRSVQAREVAEQAAQAQSASQALSLLKSVLGGQDGDTQGTGGTARKASTSTHDGEGADAAGDSTGKSKFKRKIRKLKQLTRQKSQKKMLLPPLKTEEKESELERAVKVESIEAETGPQVNGLIKLALNKYGLTRAVVKFEEAPTPHPLTVCFHFPQTFLTHKIVLDLVKEKIAGIKNARVETVHFTERNVLLGATGLENRWSVTFNCLEAVDQVLRHGIHLLNRRINLRRYDDIVREEYREYLKFTDVQKKMYGKFKGRKDADEVMEDTQNIEELPKPKTITRRTRTPPTQIDKEEETEKQNEEQQPSLQSSKPPPSPIEAVKLENSLEEGQPVAADAASPAAAPAEPVKASKPLPILTDSRPEPKPKKHHKKHAAHTKKTDIGTKPTEKKNTQEKKAVAKKTSTLA